MVVFFLSSNLGTVVQQFAHRPFMNFQYPVVPSKCNSNAWSRVSSSIYAFLSLCVTKHRTVVPFFKRYFLLVLRSVFLINPHAQQRFLRLHISACVKAVIRPSHYYKHVKFMNDCMVFFSHVLNNA